MTYTYIAPSGITVTSCKPEPESFPWRNSLHYMLWSWRKWANKFTFSPEQAYANEAAAVRKNIKKWETRLG